MNNKRQRNKLFTMLTLVMALLIPQWGWAQTASKPTLGDGSEENPFQISSVAEMIWFANLIGDSPIQQSSCAKLVKDLDMKDISWTPIKINNATSFYAGTFDGNGKTISNLNIEKSNDYYVGLFSTVKGATIKNLTLKNAIAKGDKCVGIIAGQLVNSKIYNIKIITGQVVGKKYVGSMVGLSRFSTITNSESIATVNGDDTAGGIVGTFMDENLLRNVFSSCDVTCKNNKGGLLYGSAYDTNSKVRASGIVAYDCDATLTINETASETSGKKPIGDNTSLAAGFLLGCNKETLKSGVVAYMLQQNNSSDDVVWGQNLSADNSDKYPVLGSTYQVYSNDNVTLTCDGKLTFSNSFANIVNKDEQSFSITHNGTAQLVEGTSATCKESGILRHYKCRNCNSAFEDQALQIEIPDVTDPAKSHKYNSEDVCTECNQKIQNFQVGENIVKIDKVEPLNTRIEGYNLFKFTPETSGILEIKSDKRLFYSVWNSDKTKLLFVSTKSTSSQQQMWSVAANTIYYIGVKDVNSKAIEDECTLTIQLTETPNGLTGLGVKSDPFLLQDITHLKFFADFVNGTDNVTSSHQDACAKIADDVEGIDMSSICHAAGNGYGSEASWTPIGSSNVKWKGVFDGNGKTISNLYINANTGNVGMFGYAYDGSVIKNLTLKKAIVKNAESQDNSGILVGRTYHTTIQNIVIDSESSISAGSNTGGIVGYTEFVSEISNCINCADVKGTNNIGGISGYFDTSYLKNVFSNSNLTATESGGLIVGYSDPYSLSGLLAYNKEAVLTINGTQVEAKATGSGSLSSTAYTKDEVKSGKLAYALNNGVTDGSQIWYQKLGEDGDAYPMMKSTGENTVYGAYHHGEKDRFFSNTVITNQHSTACNAEAEDEANGNHDVSYEAGKYTWTDAKDMTQDPSVAVTYTCKVCGKTETPQMTVAHDEEYDNVEATCTEDGHKYYKTSYAFNTKAVFSNAYTRTLPALGHNMSDEVTFNDSKSIYQKECTRDCGYHDYYATSDGSIVAKANDDATAFTVDKFTLNDATTYNSEAKFTVTDLTYNRSFSHDKWLAVYVPFDLNCGQLSDEYEVATINNFHEFEQKDGGHNIVLEVKLVKNGATIPALTPCLIRMKQAPETTEAKTLHFSAASFAAAADKKIDCASVTRYYQFLGTLNAKTGFDETSDFVINEGGLEKAGSDTQLKPQRWYLNASDREGSLLNPSVQLSRIAIHVIGGDETTGIDGIYVKTDTEDASSSRQGIYDLQGRKLGVEPTSGIYIKDGKKYVK